MTRRIHLFPLMAVTALSLGLAACDDNTAEDTAAPADQTMTAPAVETAPAVVATAPITAGGATAYATAEGARSGAIFMTLTNANAAAHTLTGARTDKASMVELHQGFVDEADGTMQMRKVDSIEIPPGGTVALEPGGYHIMLIDLAAPLVEGQTFDVTLAFAGAGELVVPVTITAPGAAAATTTDGATTTYTSPETHDHGDHGTMDAPVSDEGSGVAPSTTMDAPVVEVPADEPVTHTPAANEQPAQ